MFSISKFQKNEFLKETNTINRYFELIRILFKNEKLK